MNYPTIPAETLLHKCAARNLARILDNKMIPECGPRGVPFVVKTSEFMAELKRAGVSHPENIIEYFKWVEPIAKRVLPKYQKQLKR